MTNLEFHPLANVFTLSQGEEFEALRAAILATNQLRGGRVKSPQARARPPEHGLEPLRVMNPLSAEQATLRTTLRHSVLAVLARNARIWRGPLRMFESGRVYLDRGEGVGLPNEPEKFVGVVGE